MKNIAIIPIRSGSERIKHKNIKLLAGYPLIHYQIECAKQVNGIQKIVVATDNEQYGEIAKQYDVDVIMRPDDMSGPDSKSEDVLLYVLSVLKKSGEIFDNVILLQATSPLNKPEFLRQGLEMIETGNYSSILTYCDFTGFLLDDHELIKRPMSQQKSPYKMETGCFWITNVNKLEQERNRICEPCGYVKVSQRAALEIDTPDDLLIIEALLGKEVREKEKRYFKSRKLTGSYDEYYQPSADPDGNLRDLRNEKENRIEFSIDEIDFINKLKLSDKQNKLLDIGCGCGFVLSAISDNFEKHGIEIVPEAAAIAEQYATKIYTEGIEKIPFQEEFFDVISCLHVIEHISDPITFLKVVHKILKTHGHLIISSPNFDGALARRFGENFRLLHDKTHVSLFSDFSLKELLEDTGFVVDKIEYPFFDTKYFTKENLLKVFDTSTVSPAFYGNIMTLYVRKK